MPELRFARYRNEFKYTHYLFRFPAKFHPPAVRCLIDRYSRPGDIILDPFCGSGTLLLEAALSGRSAIGLDVDPVAAFISRVKCTPLPQRELERAFESIKTGLQRKRRAQREYDRLIHTDLSPHSINRFRRRLGIPNIPRIEHWFRMYVVLDLAKLRKAILRAPVAPRVRDFFLACFASIIRNASNADPVPVSGLEVTAHMKRLDVQGRRIDPFELFERRVVRELAGMGELWKQVKKVNVRVQRGDATELTRQVPATSVDVVITSPPYNTAVDYYRRHTLEMYWLDMVRSREDRLDLAPKYLGRVQVRKSNPKLRYTFKSKYINRLIAHAGSVSRVQMRAVTHYCASMQISLRHIAHVLKPNGRAVFVVGNSKWNGRRVRANKLLSELARDEFDVCDVLTYTTRNRYMSYERRNGANVNREYALILKKKTKAKNRKKPPSRNGQMHE
jgi:SAM-dependent methyltransferase